jgi:hypothetical protein
MCNVILPFRPSTSGDFSWCAHNAVQAAADKRDVIVLQLGEVKRTHREEPARYGMVDRLNKTNN